MASISVEKLLRKKFKVIELQNEFQELIGNPECAGSFIIYGPSANGKTTFAVQLLKEFCKSKKVGYNSIEEKAKFSFQNALKRGNILSVKGKLKIWISLSVEELTEELIKPKSPDVVFIDSVQYLRMTQRSVNQLTLFEYKNLINRFPNKLFIFISHAKKGEPKGSLAESILHDADVGIYIKDFIATPTKSRYGGKTIYEILKN